MLCCVVICCVVICCVVICCVVICCVVTCCVVLCCNYNCTLCSSYFFKCFDCFDRLLQTKRKQTNFCISELTDNLGVGKNFFNRMFVSA